MAIRPPGKGPPPPAAAGAQGTGTQKWEGGGKEGGTAGRLWCWQSSDPQDYRTQGSPDKDPLKQKEDNKSEENRDHR